MRPHVSEEMSRQPSLPSLTNRGNLVRTSRPATRADNPQRSSSSRACATRRQRQGRSSSPRLRALHLDPAALLARAHLRGRRHHQRNQAPAEHPQPLDKPRSFRNAAMCAPTSSAERHSGARSVLRVPPCRCGTRQAAPPGRHPWPRSSTTSADHDGRAARTSSWSAPKPTPDMHGHGDRPRAGFSLAVPA